MQASPPLPTELNPVDARPPSQPLSPSLADQYQREGLTSAAAGRIEEAAIHFAKAAALRPANSIIQFNLGLAYQQLRQFPNAISAYQIALQVSPDFFEAWMNFAAALVSIKRWADAVTAAREAVKLDPYHPNAFRLLANALGGAQNRAASQEAHRRAVELETDPFFKNLQQSAKARKQGRLAEAWRFSQAAMQIHPDHPHALFNQALHRLAQNQIQEALVCLYQAAELDPERAEVWTEIGHALMHLNGLEAAQRAYQEAIKCNSRCRSARYGLALSQLAGGNFAPAWPEFELRWNAGGPRYAPIPVWKGEAIDGKRILLYCEQGLGDMIQFARYVPLVAARGGTVVIECRAALTRLMRSVPGVESVFALGDPPQPIDLQVSVFSLPHLFQTTLRTVPSQTPYLAPPTENSVVLPETPSARLKVGLFWSGSGNFQWSLGKTIPLADLKSVWSISEIAFFSLQVKSPAQEIGEANAAERICDLSAQLVDLAATASAIQQLDLLITIDTAVAHLAGALGKPVWVLLPFAADWRWMLDRADSPWYPSMRLFRQRKRGDWRSVIREVREALKAN